MNNYSLFLIKEELEGTKAIESYCFAEHAENCATHSHKMLQRPRV